VILPRARGDGLMSITCKEFNKNESYIILSLKNEHTIELLQNKDILKASMNWTQPLDLMSRML
jgi:hypothetical protein